MSEITTEDDQNDLIRTQEALPVIKLYRVKYRWITLLLSCLVYFGSYYCFDIPGELEISIEEEFKINTVTFSWLYSIYSLPNMVLPVIDGIIIAKYGIEKSILWSTALQFFGQSLVAFGGYSKSIFIMILGRGIYGIGSEFYYIAGPTIISNWFYDQEISLAFGVSSCFPFIISAISG